MSTIPPRISAMAPWIYLISMFYFYAQLVEGDYGAKLSSNSSAESSTSFEEFYDEKSDDVTTTSDDGVIIEKAILAAEITPKASYNLVDSHRRKPQHIRRRFENTNSEKYGKSSRTHSSNLSSRGRSRNNKNSSQTTSPPTKSYGRISQKSDYQNPNFTIRVFSTQNDEQNPPVQNNNEIFDITPATIAEVYSNYGTFGGSDANTYKRSKPVDKSYEKAFTNPPLWNNYDYLYPSPSLLSTKEVNQYLEKERQSQIDATKLYLKQIEKAQEYAAKVIAMQKALQGLAQSSAPTWNSPSSNQIVRNYLPSVNVGYEEETKSQKTFPRVEAPGVSYVGSTTSDDRSHSSYASVDVTNPTPLHTSVDNGGWAGFPMYPGPIASPLVLPSGFLADTDSVIRARLAHLKALMAAIESRPPWQWQPSSQQQWR